MGGSSSQPRPWSNVTGPMSCGRVFPRLNKPSSARNRVPCRGCPSLLFPLRPQLGSLRSFRVLLLRRLFCPSLSLLAPAGVAVPLDVLGHHRAACSRAGVLGSRGFSLESAAARVCREAGARVSTNLFVRDLDLSIANHDARRLEVVADGLRCARVDGAALSEGRRRKQRTYLETLWDSGSRAVGGIGRRSGRPLV